MITRKLYPIIFLFAMRQILYTKIVRGGIDMAGKVILSEKIEDNKAAAEWGMKQAKYTPIILSRKYGRNS